MPVGLRVGRFDPADDDLDGLAGQRVELLRELEDLMGFDLLLLSHVNKPNEDAEKQPITSVWDRQDLHPVAGSTVTVTSVLMFVLPPKIGTFLPVEDLVLLHSV